jgi:hypothetical protein
LAVFRAIYSFPRLPIPPIMFFAGYSASDYSKKRNNPYVNQIRAKLIYHFWQNQVKKKKLRTPGA